MQRRRTVLNLEDRIAGKAENTEKQPVVSRQKDKSQRDLSLISELGLSLALPIIGGALLGNYLDSRFQTSPRFTVGLIVLGLTLGAISAIVAIKELLKK